MGRAAGSPQAQSVTQQNPQAAQQILQQAQQQIQQGWEAMAKLKAEPTIDQVLKLLKDQKTKAFVLDIETDSTIIPNEMAEKQGRTEFIGVLSQLLPQLAQMITADPMTADFCGEVLKFATAPFRAGRSMDGSINDLVEQMKQKAGQQQPDDAATMQNKTAVQIEQMKIQAQQQTDSAKLQLEQQKLQMQDRHKQQDLQVQQTINNAKVQAQLAETQSDAREQTMKMAESQQAAHASMMKSQADVALAQQKGDLAIQAHQLKMRESAQRSAAQQFKPPPVP
jgi:hypothetical protein